MIPSLLSSVSTARLLGRKGGRFALVTLLAVTAFGDVHVPEGTRIRVRLEQSVTSASAEEGQVVELSVADEVKIGSLVVFPAGSRVTGTITEAQEKRRMGRAGKLDFSIDRAKAIDDQWVPLRYTLNKKSGESHAVRAGVLTAGVAFVFWPAAPAFLLMKGKDITINKGVTFDVFTDNEHIVGVSKPAGTGPVSASNSLVRTPDATSSPSAPSPPSTPASSLATVVVTSSLAGADIEMDGSFVGDTPTTLQLSPGQHHIVVKNGSKIWERTLQVNAGSTISLNATFQ